VVRVPDYRTEMYSASCEVRTKFIYVMQKKVDRLCGLVVKSSSLQIHKSWARFPALPDFLKSSGSETGSTQPREYNLFYRDPRMAAFKQSINNESHLWS
jgi:hypothetical protein